MISKARYGTIVNFLLGVVLCAALGVVVLYRTDTLTLTTFTFSLISSFFVSYTIGDLVPAFAWGSKLATSLGLKQGSMVFHLVSSAVLTFVMVTLVSFGASFLVFGFTDVLVPAWSANYLYLLGAGYVVMLVTLPVGLKVADALTAGAEA